MLWDLLLPDVCDISVEDFETDEEVLYLFLSSLQSKATCPVCSQTASRIHSRYDRHVADLPWAGISVRVILHVRRFFCENAECCREIFCERIGPDILAYARRTTRFKKRLQRIAFQSGGEAGARLASDLSMKTSPDTLLRLIRSTSTPEYPTPRVLGVDDWAKRKGQTYGTVLVDLENHRRVDLLPDASAEVLATWLKAHPGVEIISRDRSSSLAAGASEGAPNAVQVADRFHLLMNLREALQRMLNHRPTDLREAAVRVAAASSGSGDTQPEPVEAVSASVSIEKASEIQVQENPIHIVEEIEGPFPNGQDDQQAVGRNARKPNSPASYRQMRFDEVKALQEERWTQRAIARHLHISRNAVKRYMDSEVFPQRRPGCSSISKVAPLWSYVTRRWDEGCHNGIELFDELQQQGFSGSYSSLRRALKKLRSSSAPFQGAKEPDPSPSLPPFQAAWLLVRPPDALDTRRQTIQSILREVSPTLGKAYDLAQGFAGMVRDRKAELLDDWLDKATKCSITELRNFASRLKADCNAVRAALSLPWSNGQVEGQVHRLKLIKRQMYGRANFDLLQKRVLYAPS